MSSDLSDVATVRSEQRRASIPFAIAAIVLAVLPLGMLVVPLPGAGLIGAAVIGAAVALAIVAVVRTTGGSGARLLGVVALSLAIATGTLSTAVGVATGAVGVSEAVADFSADTPIDVTEVLGIEPDASVLDDDEVPFAELTVGMCVNDADLGDFLWGLPVVDCDEPHDSEIYEIVDLPAGDYPGDDTVYALSDELCFQAFEAYVGLPYDESELYFLFYSPDKRSWGVDDRAVVCTLYDPDGQIEGSARGSQR
ncbi:septum formation family protein [Microcella sp.]|uniref:septum formation family protein n=1 Tax=Microcella sp. TaxID=1913979 RepID=UPI0025637C76|nr:septum formation family protein [Microcella sp.]MBX9471731.1 septum formation family protein [Microcella sp.]